MRSLGAWIDGLIATRDWEPRWVIEIEWDQLNVSAFTSHTDIQWSGAEVFAEALTEDLSTISQEIDPERFRSALGRLSFGVLDAGVTGELGARLAAGFVARDATVRVYVGLRWLYGTIMRNAPLGTWVLDRIEHDSRRGVYRFTAVERYSRTKRTAFRLRQSQIATQPTRPAGTSIELPTVAGWETVSHGPDAEWPSADYGIVRIQDEFIRWDSVATSRLTIADRGVFGSVAGDHRIGEKVSEVAYVEDRVLDLICLVLTGSRRTGSRAWPESWDIGLDRDADLDIASFDALAEDVSRIVARFFVTEEVDAKTWIETQLLPMIGCVLYTDSAGRIAIRRLVPALDGEDLILEPGTPEGGTLVSVGRLSYQPDEVRNQWEISWNVDPFEGETTRRNLYIDTNSVTRNGASEVEEIELRGLSGTRYTSQVAQSLVDYQRERLADPPLGLTARAMASACLLEAGDRVRIRAEGLADFPAQSSAMDRVYEVRRVTVDWRALRAELELLGETSPPARDTPVTGGPVLEDSFYSATGTQIPNVTNDALSTSTTLSGGTYYHQGSLEIPVGTTLRIDDTVTLHIRGTLLIRGTIEGRGRGPVGVASAAPTDWGSTPYDEPLGTPGYVGRTLPGAARRYLDTRLAAPLPGDPLSTGSNQSEQPGWQMPPLTEGTHRSAPTLRMQNIDGTQVLGVPSSTVGTSGGPGTAAEIRHSGGAVVYARGGSGGAAGAGLVVYCRGVTVESGGEILLDGGAGVSASLAPYRTGPSAGGSGGACYILLDGDSSLAVGVEERFSSRQGITPWDTTNDFAPTLAAGLGGDDRVVYLDANGDPANTRPASDQSTENLVIQYIPPRESVVPDPARAYDFYVRATPATVFIEEDTGGSIATAVSNFNGQAIAPEVLTFDQVDVSNEASFAIQATGGQGTITISIDPATGILTLTDLFGIATVTVSATIRGNTRTAVYLFARASNGTVSSATAP